MAEPNLSDLEGLVDDAITLPDCVINCTELRRLLKHLVEGVSKASQKVEDLRTTIEERFQSLEDAIAEVKQPEEPDEPEEEEEQEQPMLVQCGVPIVSEPADTPPSQEILTKEVTSETLLKEIDEQASQFREQESKLLAVIGDLEQRLAKVEQLFYQKLEHLSNEFQQFQVSVETKQNSLEEATSSASMQQNICTADQMNKLSEFTNKLNELQRQMELLLSHRDQLPMRIEALLEEKLREGELRSSSSRKSLQTGGSISSRKSSVTPSKSFSQGRIVTESAGTTQPAIAETLSCLSCDSKNVVQRMRNGRYLAPRTCAKLAVVARRLESETEVVPRWTPGARWSRTCGGSYTVVKPDERVFRQVNVQFGSEVVEESSGHDC
ncbi:uncharacterized protein LOC133392090 [Anopheles gambiae]|uniref:uncharacterized protein LOC133392090 n=1 Tax=Anopheles gambiae TaxID=7165 RepID=UPI002AC97687|nr:uncharacterized protein LOC133392090 [Anopheles gambiae]